MHRVPDNGTGEMVGTLAELLKEASGGRISLEDAPNGGEVSLRALGLDSIDFLSFVSRIEEAFSLRWREDDSSEAFQTLGTLARYLQERQSSQTSPQGRSSGSEPVPGTPLRSYEITALTRGQLS